jgi:peptidyl-prolyl cis-trans isomerase SurA
LALQDKQIKAIGKWQKATIVDTYVKVNGEYRDCDFQSNWLKNQ